MLISNPLKKLQTNSCEKSYREKEMENLSFFTFITVCKSFRPITFLGENFLHSFQRIQTQYPILFHDIELKTIFVHFKLRSQTSTKRLKKLKKVLYICILEFHLASISGLGRLHFLRKGQNHYTLVHSQEVISLLGKFRKITSRESHTCLYLLPGNCFTQPPPGQLIHAEFTTSLTTLVVFLLSVPEVVVLPA
jgi:hypothetical protein